ncbi:MAG: ferredoxin [Mycobacteriales bacterium]
MRVVVDRELCKEHGQCTLAAPKVFTLAEEGLEYDADPGPDLLDDVEASIDACPVQAISLEE